MKKILMIALSLALFAGAASAQQITKFAVVDTARIYASFYRDSRNVRDYESKKTQYQGEIKRMSDEIKKLRQDKVDAETLGDQAKAARLDSEIATKTGYLVEYSKVKNAELDTLKKKLITDDAFYSSLYAQIQKIAESDGYSMVLSLQEDNSIIWYSPTVDITEKVLRAMTNAQ